MLGGATVAVLAAIAALAVWLTWPDLALARSETHSTPTPQVFIQSFWVHNEGGTDLAVRAVDVDDPRVTLLDSSPDQSVTIGEGRIMRFDVTLKVRDCEHPPTTVPMHFRLARWWGGIQTVTVRDDAMDGGPDGAFVACVPATS
jgi:hypothetical protein